MSNTPPQDNAEIDGAERKPGSHIDTGGGASVGNVNTGGGKFVGRDEITINIHNGQVQKVEPPFMVEALPENFVPRPAEYEAIVAALLDRSTAGAVGITAALRGAGGYGKTVLARAVCHDARVRAAFPDGVLWVTLGENPSGQEQISKIGYLIFRLTGMKEEIPELAMASARLHEVLIDRRVLFVMDDVWDSAHRKPFMQGGPACGYLITTRIDHTLPAGTKRFIVDAMRQREALQLISAGLPDGKEKELQALAARLGEWALLLSLANGHLQDDVEMGYALDKALQRVNDAYDRQGLRAFNAKDREERNQAADKALAVSIEHLTPEQRERFLELAVYPEDVDIPLAAVAVLWGQTQGMDVQEVEGLCRLLYKRSLLQQYDAEGGRIRLHDVVRKYLTERQGEKITGLHDALLEGYRKLCPKGWSTGPKDGYFFRWLAYHLAWAGQAEALEDLLLDYAWIDTHLRNGGIGELLGDYEVGLAALKEEIWMMQRTLRMSASVLSRDPEQLAGQLFGRLLRYQEIGRSLGYQDGGISNLLNQALAYQKHAWLQPIKACFNGPDSAEIRTLEGHTGGIYAVAISPDGRQVVSGSEDKALKVWDLNSGECLRTLQGHTSSVYAVAISPDGHKFVSGSKDKTIKIWDLTSGELLRTLEGHTNSVYAVAISPDGHKVVSGSKDETLKVWDLDSGECLRTLEGHTGFVRALAISPDGCLVLSGSNDYFISVWDLNSGELLRKCRSTWPATSIAISPDGRRVVYGLLISYFPILRDLVTWNELHLLEGHTMFVYAVAFSPDGRLVVSGSYDRTLKVWNPDSGECLRTLEGHTYPVNAVAISPDSRLAVSASGDKTLKVWDLNSGELLPPLEGHTNYVTAIAISPDGRRVLSSSWDKTLKVWDLTSGELLRTLEGHAGMVNAVAISPDGRLVVSGSDDHTLKVWDLDNGKLLRTLEGHTDKVNAVAISADGHRILSESEDKVLKVWKLDSGELLRTIKVDTDRVHPIVISPDGRRGVSGSSDHALNVWDMISGKCLRILQGHTNHVSAIAISPDSRLVVSGSSDETLKVWDLENGDMLRTLEGHSDPVSSVAISPDGYLVVSGSYDHTLKVWKLSDGGCCVGFVSYGAITACTFSLDGKTIIAGDTGGGMYFLRLVGMPEPNES